MVHGDNFESVAQGFCEETLFPLLLLLPQCSRWAISVWSRPDQHVKSPEITHLWDIALCKWYRIELDWVSPTSERPQRPHKTCCPAVSWDDSSVSRSPESLSNGQAVCFSVLSKSSGSSWWPSNWKVEMMSLSGRSSLVSHAAFS